jgi:hypothetical protein
MELNQPPHLFEQVLHALKGEEVSRQTWHRADGTERTVEVKTFGPQRWIRRVHERGILTPVQLLAIILFSLWDFKDPQQDDGKIVSDWYRELNDAIDGGAIEPRDRNSLLPVANAKGTDWVLSLEEADAFVATRGMAWTCAEIAAHLFNEFFPDSPSLRATNAGTLTEALPAKAGPSTPATDASNETPISPTELKLTKPAANAASGDMPAGLRTPDIAAAFAGIGGWTEEQWNKNLSNGEGWITKARIRPGRRGRGSATMWDPLQLAKLAVQHRRASLTSITTAFRKHPSLALWKPEWDSYRTEINDWKSPPT